MHRVREERKLEELGNFIPRYGVSALLCYDVKFFSQPEILEALHQCKAR